jgi:glutaredoxin
MHLVISKDNCLFCSMAKDLLKENNEDFVEVNLSKINPTSDTYKAYRSLVLDLDRMSVPAVLKLVGGFDELNKSLRKPQNDSD